MESIIKEIALEPITINYKDNSLDNIMEKIILWTELIILHGTKFEDNFSYKQINLLDDDQFNYEMRIATLGKEYKNWKILPSDLHDFGESWSFENLVLASNTGIVEWYCNKFGFSKDKYLHICNDTDVQILGAFYHRMKIVLENVYRIIDFFSGKKIYNTFDIYKVKKLLLKKNSINNNDNIYNLCTKIINFEIKKEEIITKYLNLEKMTNFAQHALFSLIKNFV
jgi:hypothetical protein